MNKPAVRALVKALTVKELIDQLKKLDPELPVLLAYPAKDYARQTIGDPVEEVEAQPVRWSDYFGTFVVGGTGDGDEERTDVVVLS